MLAKLHHPNIVRFFGVASHAQHVFVVTEFLPSSLGAHVAATDVSLRHFFDLLLGVAEGLAFLHRRRTAHRDVKPSNVLVEPPRTAKLCDFGLSKMADAKRAEATMTAGVGTPAFMPPEVITGEASDARHRPASADVFSYGMLIVAAWTRKAPFAASAGDAPPPFSVMSRIASGKRPPHAPGAPRRLRALVDRCWAQDPAARPGLAEHVIPELRAIRRDWLPSEDATCSGLDAAAAEAANPLRGDDDDDDAAGAPEGS